MRNLLALLGLVLVVFLVGGRYMGWYKFDWKTGSDGRTQVQFDVDTKKVSTDLKKGGENVGNLIDGLKSNPEKKELDSSFVGPPAPDEVVRPLVPKVSPAAALPGPVGFGGKK